MDHTELSDTKGQKKQTVNQSEGEEEYSSMPDVHRQWDCVPVGPSSSSGPAARLTCAVCLDPPDGRLR